jgi:aquaporin NIP
MKKYLAESVGTFALVFFGTGAVIVNAESAGAISHVGVAITFGLIVTAMIYALGDISGAHLNPAVTFAFYTVKAFPGREVLPYVLSQSFGAFVASFCLRILFPSNELLGSTQPAGSLSQSFVLEVILTFMLMLVILLMAKGSKEQGLMAGLAIGAIVLLEAMFAGPISGASMNPARSLAPAVVSGNTQNLWLYITAPSLGALLATVVWRVLKPEPRG